MNAEESKAEEKPENNCCVDYGLLVERWKRKGDVSELGMDKPWKVGDENKCRIKQNVWKYENSKFGMIWKKVLESQRNGFESHIFVVVRFG